MVGIQVTRGGLAALAAVSCSRERRAVCALPRSPGQYDEHPSDKVLLFSYQGPVAWCRTFFFSFFIFYFFLLRPTISSTLRPQVALFVLYLCPPCAGGLALLLSSSWTGQPFAFDSASLTSLASDLPTRRRVGVRSIYQNDNAAIIEAQTWCRPGGDHDDSSA